MISKRAIRRHHRERLKQKRRSYWMAFDPYCDYPIVNNERVVRLINTPTPCSCDLCGNPRRHFGEISKQEKIANLIMADELEI